MRNKLLSLEERRLMGVTEIAQRDYSPYLKIITGNVPEGHLHHMFKILKRESSVMKQRCHQEKTETRGTLLGKGTRCHEMFIQRWYVKICLSFL